MDKKIEVLVLHTHQLLGKRVTPGDIVHLTEEEYEQALLLVTAEFPYYHIKKNAIAPKKQGKEIKIIPEEDLQPTTKTMSPLEVRMAAENQLDEIGHLLSSDTISKVVEAEFPQTGVSFDTNPLGIDDEDEPAVEEELTLKPKSNKKKK